MNTRLFLIHEFEYLDTPFKNILTKLMTEKVGNYFPSITFLTANQKKKFEEYCRSNIIHKAYRLQVNYTTLKTHNKSPYIIYLSKLKSDENIEAIRKKKRKYNIGFFGKHFHKVCKKTVENNYKFNILLDDIILYDQMNIVPPSNYSIVKKNFEWINKTMKKDDKVVTIGDKSDLVEPTNILPPPPKPKPKLSHYSAPISPIKIPTKNDLRPDKLKANKKTKTKNDLLLDKLIANKKTKTILDKSLKMLKSIL